jgi:hypothetical protein
MSRRVIERARHRAWTKQQRFSHAAMAVALRLEQLERSRAAQRAAPIALLSDEGIAIWTRGATQRQCATVAELVAGELFRRGLWRVRMGSRTYCRIEASILTEIVTRELDLDEIAFSIEEAKMEAQSS